MNPFIKELYGNPICFNIIENVGTDIIDNVSMSNLKLTDSEVFSLYTTCLHVYNSFCNDSDEDDGLSVSMNRYLDDLYSIIKKLA